MRIPTRQRLTVSWMLPDQALSSSRLHADAHTRQYCLSAWPALLEVLQSVVLLLNKAALHWLSTLSGRARLLAWSSKDVGNVA